MTRKNRRWAILIACGLGLGTATALTLSAFRDTMVFFVAPADIATKAPPPGRSFRLGGLVDAGSVEKTDQAGRPLSRFRITDGAASVAVEFGGILPDLFREGQGGVTLGTLRPDGSFLASEVLAKHDETYMPKEVADALKKSGRWQPGAPPPPASTWNSMDPKKVGG